MSPSPAETTDGAALDRYGRAWADVMRRVRLGYSWSGHERNCAYLNEGGSGRFADVSALAGFDFSDDGRALALTDWDQDGDLDVWLRNRSAPRLRLLLNQCKDRGGVALKLEGTVANRDAIGAVVALAVQTKSVRAGDLFLSQSSKWLHFGLGRESDFGSVRVRWPGGAEETFAGVTSGGRFVLKQGSGQANRLKPRGAAVGLAAPVGLPVEKGTSSARIVFPARVPMPELRYRDKAAQLRAVASDGSPMLLALWSASCGHCEEELENWSRRPPKTKVLALAVDRFDDDGLGAVYGLMDRLQPAFEWGVLDTESLAALARLQEALFDGEPPLSVPVTILLDGKGGALALYRGGMSADALDADAARLSQASPLELHHLAAPLPGTWFTNPVDPRWYAESVRRALSGRK